MDRTGKRTKHFVFAMILSVLLCSFLEVNTENIVSNAANHLGGQLGYVTQVNDFDELISPEEILGHTSQSAIVRQICVRRYADHSFGTDLAVGLLVLVPVCIAFLYRTFGYSCLNCSQKFILRFIHNKDGQKA